MCGICLLLSGPGPDAAASQVPVAAAMLELQVDCPPNLSLVLDVISRRGPDATNIHNLSPRGMTFIASVLHIQGTKMCIQPHVDKVGNVLLWNGEVFGVEANPIFDAPSPGMSDTISISNLLHHTLSDAGGGVAEVVLAMSYIHGPYAFVYYHERTRTILYGRDPFGRRSLLVLRQNEQLVAISSVAVDLALPSGAQVWREVSVTGIQQILLHEDSSVSELPSTPWPPSRLRLTRNRARLSEIMPVPGVATKLLQVLRFAVKRRIVTTNASPGVLFSGGIDSVLLAALLHQCMAGNPDQPIELINVTFLGEAGAGDLAQSPDRLAAISALVELKILFPTRPWLLVHVDVEPAERIQHSAQIQKLLVPRETNMDFNIGAAFWFAARGRGYLREYSDLDASKSFEAQVQGRPLLRIGGEGAAKGVGLHAWAAAHEKDEKVRTLCSNPECGKFRKLGCIHASCSRCCYKQQTQMTASMCRVHKSNAVLIGSDALSFPPQCLLREPSMPESVDNPHVCACKVLLVGIGADEQMAGYGRHRTTFIKGGQEALENELSMDMARLWERNLGRDDRVISDNGRESWFPYLDEAVVAFLQSLPISDIADLTLPPGIGEKKILREAAQLLGLESRLVKRAVQFGTGIAKATNRLQLGSNRKGKGSTLMTKHTATGNLTK